MSDVALDLLRSIDASLKALVALSQQRISQARAAQPKPIAPDRDLDSKYGDPEVKLNPRDWTGPSMKQRRMSECPAEFLDLLAETFDYFGDKAEANNELHNGKPVAPYKRRDAARARGWAARHRKNGGPKVDDGAGSFGDVEEASDFGEGADWPDADSTTDGFE